MGDDAIDPKSFERECLELGRASAAAKLRLDVRGPEPYRKAFESYRGPKAIPSYFERKRLSLRLSAVKRAMVVDPTITAEFLARITDGRCPVTHEVLDIEGRSPNNPSVDRLVNEVTYIAGNICVLCIRANRAKAELTFEQVAEIAQSGEPSSGLEPVEWMRLASLMYGAWARAQKRADPYLLPLAAIPGRGLFMSTSQVVQMLLTRHATAGSDEAAVLERWLGLTEEGGGTEQHFLDFFAALRAALAEERHPGNAWLHGHVFEGFVHWYSECRGAVAPAVESLLQAYQSRVNDPVAVLDWPTGSRYQG
jgi:hypothetical protein